MFQWEHLVVGCCVKGWAGKADDGAESKSGDQGYRQQKQSAFFLKIPQVEKNTPDTNN
jgi:hypothetical protein